MVSNKWTEVHGINLTDMIGLALHKDTYTQLLERIHAGQSLDGLEPIANDQGARNHRSKILREEITKQFSDDLQPIAQLFQNAIDAKPDDHQGAYRVGTKVGTGSCVIVDEGKGMDIETVINTFLIPFRSDKDPQKDLGRHGVGFFSALEYCLNTRWSSGLRVSTAKDGTVCTMEFYAKGTEVDDIYFNLHIGPDKNDINGTTVHAYPAYRDVNGSKTVPPKRELMRYIRKYYGFFDHERAKIRTLKGKPINPPPSKDEKEYKFPVELDDGRTDYCRVRFGKAKKDRGEISLHSQGIYVCGELFGKYDVKIDLPPQVLIVEGRDEFKRDDTYTAAFKGIVDFVCKNHGQIAEEFDQEFDVKRLLPYLINVSQVSGQLLPVIRENIDSIFDGKRYIIWDRDLTGAYTDLIDFFGEEVKDSVYITDNSGEYKYWKELMGDIGALIDAKTKESEMDAYGVTKLCPELRSRWRTTIVPVTIETDEPTRSMCIGDSIVDNTGDRTRVIVNVEHQLMQDMSFLGRYMRSCQVQRSLYSEGMAEQELVGGGLD